MTQEEANIKIINMNTSLGMCPLLKESCDPRCVCYVKAKAVYHGDKEGYIIVPPKCSNKMMF